MYEGAENAAQAVMLGDSPKRLKGIDRPSPTLAQNIDDRIESLTTQIARLENVKRLLAEPAGLLAVPIDDLRFAMNY